MPNLITHIWFGEEVLKALPEEIGAKVKKHKDAFILGNMGPDFMYAIRELGFKTANYPNACTRPLKPWQNTLGKTIVQGHIAMLLV